ncbi:MAG TPA: phosphoadenylyl-sulfate reductase [Deltaproteobacteria bacterium]|nr:phosphoadenylyl-sulfate reductase [Deltaproteobacteria bacterium]
MSAKVWTEEELSRVNEELDSKGPEDALRWALDNFHPNVALACSYGPEDVALVDMLLRIRPDARVFYLDTELLFKETYDVRDRIAEKYGLKAERFASRMSLEEMEKEYGPELWKRDPKKCCQIRKISALKEALGTLSAWITGIRREQSPTRANAPIVGWDSLFNLVKINPLVKWTEAQVWEYIRSNDVPYNVLHDRNYPSIGCEPCTQPVKPGEDPRAGRWAGHAKTECGLHKDE